MTVSNTNGTGNLTATVTDTFMPGLLATTKTLSRYWFLNGSSITTNLTFNYVNSDVPGTESDYKVFRRPLNNNSLIKQFPLSAVDTVSNTITAFNVSQFSDWGAGTQPLAAVAATVSVAGKVMTKDGNGIRNAVVTLIDSSGTTRTARTSSFGYYTFETVEVGATYTINVAAKRFTFANPTQVITVHDNLGDLDFIAG